MHLLLLNVDENSPHFGEDLVHSANFASPSIIACRNAQNLNIEVVSIM